MGRLLRTYQPLQNFICNHALARKQPSFVKDTTDLLNRIEELNKQGPFSEGSLLVSGDVISMFPNIDNELG